MILASQLHASLEDPVLDSINFLNEIVGRFPKAISFAPGAPDSDQLSDIDIDTYVNCYIQYICQSQSLKPEQAKRILYNYGPTAGLINDIIAKALEKDKKLKLEPADLVITVGAQEAILIVLRALFRCSEYRLAVVNPCYSGIIGAARLLNIDIIGIDETAQGIDIKQLDEACVAGFKSNRPIRAFYIAPDFSNPTGSLLDLETRRHLLNLAERHDFLLIEDSVYAFTAPRGEEMPTLKELDTNKRVILLGSFAKSCLPGARVGYVIADQLVIYRDGSSRKLANELVKIKSMTTVNTSAICQAIIAGMILKKAGSITALEREKTNIYQDKLTVLLGALKRHLIITEGKFNSVSWNQPRGGFFVRLRLPIPVDMNLLKRSASDYGVLWTPMSSFYLSQSVNNELRLSCSYLNHEQIEEGVSRLANFINNIS